MPLLSALLQTIKRIKGYLRYKTKTSQSVPSHAQVKNFISQKIHVAFLNNQFFDS